VLHVRNNPLPQKPEFTSNSTLQGVIGLFRDVCSLDCNFFKYQHLDNCNGEL